MLLSGKNVKIYCGRCGTHYILGSIQNDGLIDLQQERMVKERRSFPGKKYLQRLDEVFFS